MGLQPDERQFLASSLYDYLNRATQTQGPGQFKGSPDEWLRKYQQAEQADPSGGAAYEALADALAGLADRADGLDWDGESPAPPDPVAQQMFDANVIPYIKNKVFRRRAVRGAQEAPVSAKSIEYAGRHAEIDIARAQREAKLAEEGKPVPVEDITAPSYRPGVFGTAAAPARAIGGIFGLTDERKTLTKGLRAGMAPSAEEAYGQQAAIQQQAMQSSRALREAGGGTPFQRRAARRLGGLAGLTPQEVPLLASEKAQYLAKTAAEPVYGLAKAGMIGSDPMSAVAPTPGMDVAEQWMRNVEENITPRTSVGTVALGEGASFAGSMAAYGGAGGVAEAAAPALNRALTRASLRTLGRPVTRGLRAVPRVAEELAGKVPVVGKAPFLGLKPNVAAARKVMPELWRAAQVGSAFRVLGTMSDVAMYGPDVAAQHLTSPEAWFMDVGSAFAFPRVHRFFKRSKPKPGEVAAQVGRVAPARPLAPETPPIGTPRAAFQQARLREAGILDKDVLTPSEIGPALREYGASRERAAAAAQVAKPGEVAAIGQERVIPTARPNMQQLREYVGRRVKGQSAEEARTGIGNDLDNQLVRDELVARAASPDATLEDKKLGAIAEDYDKFINGQVGTLGALLSSGKFDPKQLQGMTPDALEWLLDRATNATNTQEGKFAVRMLAMLDVMKDAEAAKAGAAAEGEGAAAEAPAGPPTFEGPEGQKRYEAIGDALKRIRRKDAAGAYIPIPTDADGLKKYLREKAGYRNEKKIEEQAAAFTAYLTEQAERLRKASAPPTPKPPEGEEGAAPAAPTPPGPPTPPGGEGGEGGAPAAPGAPTAPAAPTAPPTAPPSAAPEARFTPAFNAEAVESARLRRLRGADHAAYLDEIDRIYADDSLTPAEADAKIQRLQEERSGTPQEELEAKRAEQRGKITRSEAAIPRASRLADPLRTSTDEFIDEATKASTEELRGARDLIVRELREIRPEVEPGLPVTVSQQLTRLKQLREDFRNNPDEKWKRDNIDIFYRISDYIDYYSKFDWAPDMPAPERMNQVIRDTELATGPRKPVTQERYLQILEQTPVDPEMLVSTKSIPVQHLVGREVGEKPVAPGEQAPPEWATAAAERRVAGQAQKRLGAEIPVAEMGLSEEGQVAAQNEMITREEAQGKQPTRARLQLLPKPVERDTSYDIPLPFAERKGVSERTRRQPILLQQKPTLFGFPKEAAKPEPGKPFSIAEKLEGRRTTELALLRKAMRDLPASKAGKGKTSLLELPAIVDNLRKMAKESGSKMMRGMIHNLANDIDRQYAHVINAVTHQAETALPETAVPAIAVGGEVGGIRGGGQLRGFGLPEGLLSRIDDIQSTIDLVLDFEGGDLAAATTDARGKPTTVGVVINRLQRAKQRLLALGDKYIDVHWEDLQQRLQQIDDLLIQDQFSAAQTATRTVDMPYVRDASGVTAAAPDRIVHYLPGADVKFNVGERVETARIPANVPINLLYDESTQTFNIPRSDGSIVRLEPDDIVSITHRRAALNLEPGQALWIIQQLREMSRAKIPEADRLKARADLATALTTMSNEQLAALATYFDPRGPVGEVAASADVLGGFKKGIFQAESKGAVQGIKWKNRPSLQAFVADILAARAAGKETVTEGTVPAIAELKRTPRTDIRDVKASMEKGLLAMEPTTRPSRKSIGFDTLVRSMTDMLFDLRDAITVPVHAVTQKKLTDMPFVESTAAGMRAMQSIVNELNTLSDGDIATLGTALNTVFQKLADDPKTSHRKFIANMAEFNSREGAAYMRFIQAVEAVRDYRTKNQPWDEVAPRRDPAFTALSYEQGMGLPGAEARGAVAAREAGREGTEPPVEISAEEVAAKAGGVPAGPKEGASMGERELRMRLELALEHPELLHLDSEGKITDQMVTEAYELLSAPRDAPFDVKTAHRIGMALQDRLQVAGFNYRTEKARLKAKKDAYTNELFATKVEATPERKAELITQLREAEKRVTEEGRAKVGLPVRLGQDVQVAYFTKRGRRHRVVVVRRGLIQRVTNQLLKLGLKLEDKSPEQERVMGALARIEDLRASLVEHARAVAPTGRRTKRVKIKTGDYTVSEEQYAELRTLTDRKMAAIENVRRELADELINVHNMHLKGVVIPTDLLELAVHISQGKLTPEEVAVPPSVVDVRKQLPFRNLHIGSWYVKIEYPGEAVREITGKDAVMTAIRVATERAHKDNVHPDTYLTHISFNQEGLQGSNFHKLIDTRAFRIMAAIRAKQQEAIWGVEPGEGEGEE